jgi:hypothetical protein
MHQAIRGLSFASRYSVPELLTLKVEVQQPVERNSLCAEVKFGVNQKLVRGVSFRTRCVQSCSFVLVETALSSCRPGCVAVCIASFRLVVAVAVWGVGGCWAGMFLRRTSVQFTAEQSSEESSTSRSASVVELGQGQQAGPGAEMSGG